MLPTIFVSHGAPTLPLSNVPAKLFLQHLPDLLAERPRAILAVSAHWEAALPTVNSVALNDTIHDFTGFQSELYELCYPAPGSARLAERITKLLVSAGLPAGLDHERGLDHGAWVPLRLMYPEADIPVVQLSVQTEGGPRQHFALGEALQPLREEGVLIVGSGSFTHDLSSFRAYRDAIAEPEPVWVSAFADWFDRALSERRLDDLLAYRREAPHAARNHPTEEHLLPLYVALGAAGRRAKVDRLHTSLTHGVLRMDVYAFGQESRAPEAR